MKREELLKQKELLLKNLEELEKNLNKIDKEFYKGKLNTAIQSLKECLDYFNYPTIELECPDCCQVNDYDLDVIICGLEEYGREVFSK